MTASRPALDDDAVDRPDRAEVLTAWPACADGLRARESALRRARGKVVHAIGLHAVAIIFAASAGRCRRRNRCGSSPRGGAGDSDIARSHRVVLRCPGCPTGPAALRRDVRCGRPLSMAGDAKRARTGAGQHQVARLQRDAESRQVLASQAMPLAGWPRIAPVLPVSTMTPSSSSSVFMFEREPAGFRPSLAEHDTRARAIVGDRVLNLDAPVADARVDHFEADADVVGGREHVVRR